METSGKKSPVTDYITSKTNKVGLIGWPIEHSFSPRMHNAAFREAGLDWVYLPLPVNTEVESLERALLGLPALGFLGANVTIPHKQNVVPLVTQISEIAKSVGAINTLTIGPDSSIGGENTDIYGFLTPLLGLTANLESCRALLLGAGGAARSVAFGLAQAGCRHLVVYNRTVRNAERLLAGLGPVTSGMKFSVLSSFNQLQDVVSEISLVVNATSVGMYPRASSSPVPQDFPWRPSMIAYDLVYNPRETLFLAQARACGTTCIDGLEMLLFQGARSFEIWTGLEPHIETMRGQLHQHFAETCPCPQP